MQRSHAAAFPCSLLWTPHREPPPIAPWYLSQGLSVGECRPLSKELLRSTQFTFELLAPGFSEAQAALRRPTEVTGPALPSPPCCNVHGTQGRNYLETDHTVTLHGMGPSPSQAGVGTGLWGTWALSRKCTKAGFTVAGGPWPGARRFSPVLIWHLVSQLTVALGSVLQKGIHRPQWTTRCCCCNCSHGSFVSH